MHSYWLLPAALRAAQACRYLIYSEADFEVFRPEGTTRYTDGGEIWRNFTPIGATTGVQAPKTEIFYSDLTEMWNINAPRGVSRARFLQNLQGLYPISGYARC